MHDLSDLFVGLLRLVGITVEEEGERTQALALFATCSVFGLVAGCLTAELAAKCWFAVAGFCSAAFLVVAIRKGE